MLRSMFAAVSGLRSHQTMMDVVGNNIANVNTTGYKSSRATFQEALNQTLRGASGTGPERAGTNAMQIGLGSTVASIDGVFTQGSTQATGRTGDLAIQGEGFFVVGAGAEQSYTRAGAFNFDENGYLATPGGLRLQGWAADAAGQVNPNGPISDLQLPMGQTVAPTPTGEITLAGNLPAGGAVGEEVNTSITGYDAQGAAYDVALRLTKTAADTWDLAYSVDGGAYQELGTATDGDLQFDGDGELATAGPLSIIGPDGTPVDIAIGGLSQYGGDATAEARNQDGSAMGVLRSFEFGQDGTITGRYSNGDTQVLGLVALATFNNPAGLVREGQSLFAGSANSGEAIIGQPGTGDAGVISPGALEMSNVDLAQEFTNLIIAQRGFQANSRGITASDELLQELVNLKR